MRQNPSFAMTDVAELRRLIARNPWATLVSATDDGIVASHYAVLLDDERDDLTVVGHVASPTICCTASVSASSPSSSKDPTATSRPAGMAMSPRFPPGTTSPFISQAFQKS